MTSASRQVNDQAERERQLRRKRLWNVADFALFLGGGTSHRQAKRLLLRWDRESGGRLLTPSEGRVNRRYEFAPAVLMKLHPEIFDRIESLEARVDELEEGVGELRGRQKRLGLQVGQNSADIAKHGEQLRLFRRAS